MPCCGVVLPIDRCWYSIKGFQFPLKPLQLFSNLKCIFNKVYGAALEWHNENSEDEDAGGISEILPAPLSGIESIMLLTLIAAALARSWEELSEIDYP